MKPHLKTFQQFQRPVRGFLLSIALLALSSSIFADSIDATYRAGTEVPITSNGFSATGKTVNLTLNYAPVPGTQLMIVQNTGPNLIVGAFSNLAPRQIVALNYGGATYHFVVNYNGGSGNDLVLLWTSDKKPVPASILKKLDDQLILALRKSRGDPPFDKATSLEPDIRVQQAGRVLVEIEGSVSTELLKQVAALGGRTVQGSEKATSFRAMIALGQLEALASRSDVKFITPVQLTVTSGTKPSR